MPRAGLLSLLAALACIGAAPAHGGEAPPSPVLTVPLTVHLARNFEVTKGGVRMSTWIEADDIRQRVMPEVNRIWAQAGIEWKLMDVAVIDEEMPLLEDLAIALRNAKGGPDERPEYGLSSLLNIYGRNMRPRADSYNLVVFPYLGDHVLGRASGHRGLAYVAAWGDNPTESSGPVQKVVLTPIHGAFSEVSAHELGHLLGLDHFGCEGQCLMNTGGDKLSSDEIATARKLAQAPIPKAVRLLDDVSAN